MASPIALILPQPDERSAVTPFTRQEAVILFEVAEKIRNANDQGAYDSLVLQEFLIDIIEGLFFLLSQLYTTHLLPRPDDTS